MILGSDVREFYPDTDANTGTPEQSRERLRRFDLLTQRETELAACVAQGLTNQEIADHLFISVSTVKNHLRSVFRKLEVQSRLELRRLLEDSGAFDSVPRGSGQLQHVSAWGSIPRGR